jgi:uncharacterized protein (DUF1499 family)
MKQKLARLAFYGLAGIAVLGAIGTAMLAVAARRVGAPSTIGVHDGRLAPCPSTPNCVSTQAERPDQYLAPLPFSGSAEAAIEAVAALIAAEPRTEIIVVQPDYLHAVFRSPTFGFPDDVEFYADETAGLLHFRSAARIGKGDAGVNRSRMERLSAALATQLATR